MTRKGSRKGEKVDIIFKADAMAANKAHIPLEELAYNETNKGNI